MVGHEIDPGARRQGGQLLEEFQRLEEQMPRAIRPDRLVDFRLMHYPATPKSRGADVHAIVVAAHREIANSIFHIIRDTTPASGANPRG